MPQLDFIIIFSQIFWLIILFFILYTAITHFFLPSFVKSLSSRKHILTKNTESLSELQLNFNSKQAQLNSLLNKNFTKTKDTLERQIFCVFFSNPNFNLELIDKKIIIALYYNIIYYDLNILQSIPLKLKFVNLKTF